MASSLEAFSYNPHPVHQQIPGSSFQSHFHCHPTGASHQAQATGISDWACCNRLIIWSLVLTASAALSNQSDVSNDFCSHLESNPKFWLRPTEPSKMTPPDIMPLPTLTHSASATLTFLLLLKHSEHLSTLAVAASSDLDILPLAIYVIGCLSSLSLRDFHHRVLPQPPCPG